MFGTADPLIPAEDRQTIASALRTSDSAGARLSCVTYDGADHGFMCEARSSFDPQASAQGWSLLLGDDPAV